MTSDGGKFCFCAMDVLRLGVSYSSVVVWAYVIMGECWWPFLWGGGGVMFAVVFCLSAPALRFGYLQVPYTIIVDSVSLFVVCCICESFCGSWIGVRWLSTT